MYRLADSLIAISLSKIEGAVTIAIGLALRFIIDDFPDRAKFLSVEERATVMQRLNTDRGNASTEKVTWKNLKDLKGTSCDHW